MTTINHLPNEMLPLIFKHLGVRDLLKCRLVSKKWRFFIDEVKISELVIAHKFFSYPLRHWYRTKSEITFNNSITLRQTQRCPFVLDDVERLRIEDVISPDTFNFNRFIANFPKLCHLEIDWLRGRRNKRIRLDLPASVKTIYLHCVENMKLQLNASHLETVYCGSDIRNIRFSHPDSIKHVKINNLERFNDNVGLQVLPNVEFLNISEHSFTLHHTQLDLLRLFPKAKQMYFGRRSCEEEEDYDNLEEILAGLIHRKRTLGRTDLNIFCDGIEMDRWSLLRLFRGENVSA